MKNIQKKYNEVAKKHNAVSEQYKIALNKLDEYDYSFTSIEQILRVAIQSSKKDRFETAWSLVIKIYSNIKGGNIHGR